MRAPSLIAIVPVALLAAATPAQVPQQSAAQKRVEAKLLEQKRQECARKGQFAVATTIRNAVLYKCVSASDPAFKAQSTPKP